MIGPLQLFPRPLLPPSAAATAAAPARRLRLSLEPRFHIVLACFLATVTIYVERVGFSIAFTSMASKVGGRGGVAGAGEASGRRQAGRCASRQMQPACTAHLAPNPLQVGVDEGIKGAVLSAFYWGYAISQVVPSAHFWSATCCMCSARLAVLRRYLSSPRAATS